MSLKPSDVYTPYETEMSKTHNHYTTRTVCGQQGLGRPQISALSPSRPSVAAKGNHVALEILLDEPDWGLLLISDERELLRNRLGSSPFHISHVQTAYQRVAGCLTLSQAAVVRADRWPPTRVVERW